MKSFIAQLALFLAVAEARKLRTQQESILEDDPEDFDIDTIVVRHDLPSGFEAGPSERDQRQSFMNWAAFYGKNYKTTDEMGERQAQWRATNEQIRENNLRSERSGNPDAPFMDHNLYSDWTEEESNKLYADLSGDLYNVEDDIPIIYDDEEEDLDDDRRHLAGKKMREKDISFDSNVLGPVQNQGNCGSCWAFGLLTPLEAAVALKTDMPWRQLSSQHLVDCTNWKDKSNIASTHGFDPDLIENLGCDGGLKQWTYPFLQDHGVMWAEDYPYESGADHEERQCRHDPTKAEIGVKQYRAVPQDPFAMRRKLERGPLAISMAWGTGLRNYKSGVIPAGDASFCASRTNHALALVGYTSGTNPQKETKLVHSCRRRFKKDYPSCRHANEYIYEEKFCCSAEEVKVEHSDGAYWTIQNSHGTGWGENGYGRIEVSEGVGVCNINTRAYTASPKWMLEDEE